MFFSKKKNNNKTNNLDNQIDVLKKKLLELENTKDNQNPNQNKDINQQIFDKKSVNNVFNKNQTQLNSSLNKVNNPQKVIVEENPQMRRLGEPLNEEAIPHLKPQNNLNNQDINNTNKIPQDPRLAYIYGYKQPEEMTILRRNEPNNPNDKYNINPEPRHDTRNNNNQNRFNYSQPPLEPHHLKPDPFNLINEITQRDNLVNNFKVPEEKMEEIDGIIVDLGNGISINLPIRKRMPLEEFLKIAEKVRSLEDLRK